MAARLDSSCAHSLYFFCTSNSGFISWPCICTALTEWLQLHDSIHCIPTQVTQQFLTSRSPLYLFLMLLRSILVPLQYFEVKTRGSPTILVAREGRFPPIKQMSQYNRTEYAPHACKTHADVTLPYVKCYAKECCKKIIDFKNHFTLLI